MILQNKIDRLTEQELEILLFCLNEFKSSENEINMQELKWIRPQFAFLALNEQAAKTKEDKRHIFQGIADKIIN